MDAESTLEQATPATPKRSKGGLIGCIVLLILLIGVSVFAVITTINAQNKISEADNLKKEIATKDEKLESLKNAAGVENVDDLTADVIKSKAYDPNYIYLPEAKMKLKISDELQVTGYLHETGIGFYFWAIPTGLQYFPEYANPDQNRSGQAAIGVDKKSEIENAECEDGYYGFLCDMKYVTDAFVDGYIITYSHPQAVYSQDKTEMDAELKTVELLEKMLTNPDNYSEI